MRLERERRRATGRVGGAQYKTALNVKTVRFKLAGEGTLGRERLAMPAAPAPAPGMTTVYGGDRAYGGGGAHGGGADYEEEHAPPASSGVPDTYGSYPTYDTYGSIEPPQPPQPPQPLPPPPQQPPPPEEPPQADEYGQHLRAKRQAIDDAVASARRSAAFEALFGPDGR